MNLLWLRRDLRLHDHAVLAEALASEGPVQPVFVFDSEVLARFKNPQDRRLSFIVEALAGIHHQLREKNGGLLVVHGKASEVIPKLAKALKAERVVAAEDYEPAATKRDHAVAKALGSIPLRLVKDHMIFAPQEILRGGEAAYKVYTPYAKKWRAAFTPDCMAEIIFDIKGRFAEADTLREKAQAAGIKVVSTQNGPAAMLREIGYVYKKDTQWPVDGGKKRLKKFAASEMHDYTIGRNMLAEDGTSQISPYIRFGLVSVRECFRAAHGKKGSDMWLGELIWREFYMMIMFHYPESAHTEWNPLYRDKLEWSKSKKAFQTWVEGKTGYPVVDAAMRQLLEMGWMHNRARMITASFLCKDLLIDWRLGEEHFAQYLMDYEQSSNVGGWQWCASTGTDAQPYFRIFNPESQAKKFDPQGEYAKRYVPELRALKKKEMHHSKRSTSGANYPEPMVDHAESREHALAMYKRARKSP